MKPIRFIPLLIFAAALLWYVTLVIRFPTAGAIGDDPATYVLMARDLAERGTVVHDFPLFTKGFDRNLSWDAFIMPGYHIVRATGLVAPNFAFGFPLLLAFAYRVFGENALYWMTPLLGALTLVATFALGNELLRNFPSTRRRTISALAVLLIATSPKQIQLVLVPMSDVPTQLFCVLALWCALRVAIKTQRVFDAHATVDANVSKTLWVLMTFAALGGLALGMAYLTRHSALAMLAPLALVAMRWGESRRERVLLITVALAVFVLTILPDVLYRANVLGSVFAVESPESAQTNVYDAPRQFLEMFGALFSVTGFGPLILFVPIGWWILAREKNRFAAFVLAVWILAFMLLHAPLKLTGVFENSLRYLIPAYPALALSASVAVMWIFERAWNGMRAPDTRFTLRMFLIYMSALVCMVALGIALRAVIGPERFAARAYGWMSGTARRDLESLDAQLPPNAVIGVSDQMAGATLLYAQREIFRPANFLEPAREFPQFLREMKNEKRVVYLLGEWDCGGDASARLPAWLGEYAIGDWRLEIRELPYACAQRLTAIQE